MKALIQLDLMQHFQTRMTWAIEKEYLLIVILAVKLMKMLIKQEISQFKMSSLNLSSNISVMI